MGGVNPYITPTDAELPKEKYTITFLPEGIELVVDPKQLPYGHNGLPGSILDLAHAAGVPLDHACGGVCACSTCHVVVQEGLDSCNEATDEELDELEQAPGITMESRLGCQCVPNGTQNVVIEIPGWNRNLVKEGHGE